MDATPDARGSARGSGNDAWFSAFAFSAALVPRLYVAIAWPREPVWDGHYYDFGARRIAAGLGYSDGTTAWHPWCHWPVGYSGLLAGLYRVFDDGPRVATIANAVLGALLVVAVHRLARLWLPTWRARLAAVLAAVQPGLVVYAALVMTEPVAALSLVVAAWLAIRDRDRGALAWRGLVLGGVVLGLGTLVRPTFAAHAPFLALAWVRPGPALWPSLRRAALGAAVALASALLVVAPWTLRNCRVMDRCAFVSTNGGWNLAIGAFPRATGRFETLRASDGCPVVTGQVQQDECWRDVGVAAIRRDPARWLGLVPAKLGYTFDQESFPVEYLHEADPDRWPDERRTRGRELLTRAHRLLLALAALSIVPIGGARGRLGRVVQLALAATVAALFWVAFAREPAAFWPLAVAIAALGALPLPGAPPRGPVMAWIAVSLAGTIGTHAVMFGEDRYHMVVTPLLCVLAAGALRRSAPPRAPG